MNIFLKMSVLLVLPVALLSCTCATPLRVSEIQKTDKKLSCKEVILEINESEHYRDIAQQEYGIGLGNMLMPVCWISSYTDTSSAIKAANVRIEYLGRIYDVLDCGGKSDSSERMISPPIIKIHPLPASTVPLFRTRNNTRSIQKNIVFPDKMAPQNIHKHMDKFKKVYTHSHAHTGAHKHLDD